MIAIDTNVIVRFLTADDEGQYGRAKAIFAGQQEIFIADTVILECEWVLRYAYEFSPQQINHAFTSLLGLAHVKLSNPARMQQVLSMHLQGLDFADALHLASSAEQAHTFFTFDKKLVRAGDEYAACQVREP